MKNSLLYMRDDIQAFYAREDRKERVLYQVANVALLALACLGLGAVWMGVSLRQRCTPALLTPTKSRWTNRGICVFFAGAFP